MIPVVVEKAAITWIEDAPGCMAQTKEGAFKLQERMTICTAVELHRIWSSMYDKMTVTQMYKSPHCNHVLSRLIECARHMLLTEIYECIMSDGSLHALCRHTYGSRVAERLIENAQNPWKEHLAEALLELQDVLVNHQWGNYVVQSFLEHMSEQRRTECIELLLSRSDKYNGKKYTKFVYLTAVRYNETARLKEPLERTLQFMLKRSAISVEGRAASC